MSFTKNVGTLVNPISFLPSTLDNAFGNCLTITNLTDYVLANYDKGDGAYVYALQPISRFRSRKQKMPTNTTGKNYGQLFRKSNSGSNG